MFALIGRANGIKVGQVWLIEFLSLENHLSLVHQGTRYEMRTSNQEKTQINEIY